MLFCAVLLTDECTHSNAYWLVDWLLTDPLTYRVNNIDFGSILQQYNGRVDVIIQDSEAKSSAPDLMKYRKLDMLSYK